MDNWLDWAVSTVIGLAAVAGLVLFGWMVITSEPVVALWGKITRRRRRP